VPEVWGEFDVDCRDNSVGGTRDALIAQLRRGYVRAAPGRLSVTRWDDQRASLEASGQAGGNAGDDGARLVAFHPASRARDVRVTVRGLDAPDLLPVAGGGLLVSARTRGGPWSITIARLSAR
jgi:hypothetical protein